MPTWRWWRRAGGAAVVMGGTSTYFYHKHLYEVEMFTQMNHLFQGRSNIYLQQRQAFPSFWFLQWLIPYHQSLVIIDPQTGQRRHIGLGHSPGAKTFERSSEFVPHEGGQFRWLNRYEISIPIDMWVDYQRKYGHFPQAHGPIDIDILNALTRCVGEEHLANICSLPTLPRYHTQFLSPQRDDQGDWHLSTCQTAVMTVIRQAELLTAERKMKATTTQQSPSE